MVALANAQAIVGLKRRLGVFWEPTLQRMVIDDPLLVTLMNWIYIWGHWPVIASIGIWLFLRHRPTYMLARNALLVSGAIGLVIFATFPVAPPRLTDLEVRDTVTVYSRSYRVLQPPQFVNQYAALPSLHFGWDLLIGMVALRAIRWRPVKLLCWLMPLAMLLAIILTANHYILDAVAGAVVALTGLWLAQHLVRPTSALAPPFKPLCI